MYKITPTVKTGGLLTILLVFTFSFLIASTENINGLTVTTVEAQAVSCYNLSDGSIDVSITGGDGNYTYSWTGPGNYTSTNEDISGLAAGTYNLEVNDESGNSGSTTIIISQPDELVLSNSTSTNALCHGESNGSITIGTVTGGNSDFEYSLDAVNWQISKTFDGLAAGNYTIYVKDNKGCQATENITITEPDPLTATSPSFTAVSCNGGSDGTITAGTPSGGNGGYTFSINGTSFQSSASFNSLSAGSYTITIKDAKECEITQSISITEPDPLTATSPSSTAVSCNGGSDGTITAGTPSGGNGGYTFSINGTSFQSSASFNSLSAGSYTITIKDAKECEITQSISITEPDPLTATSPSSTAVSCNGGSDGTITAGTPSGGNGGYTFSINGTSFQSSASFNSLSAGSYTITIKDAKECEITQSISITEPDRLTATSPSSTAVSCNGGSDGTITAGTPSGGNGGYTFSINGTSFQSSASFNSLSAGSYTITIKDAKECEITQSISITEPDPLTATSPSSTAVSCNGGSDGTITAGTPSGGNGNYLYALNNGTFSSSKTFSNLSAGSYKLKIKDSKNCELIQDIEVTEPAPLSMTEPSSTEVTCYGGANGTITVGTMSGGNDNYQYSLDNTNFTSETTFTGLTAGNYTIFVKDDKNCALQKSISVTQPNQLKASLAKTNVKCHNGSDGSITISSPSGGHSNYEYSINGTTWQNSGNFTGLSSGTYSVSVRDAEYPSCSVVLNAAYEISQPADPLSATVSTTRTTVYQTSTGTAEAFPVGGSPGYTYEWRKKGENTILQTTKKATDLAAGNYELTVVDFNGCKFTTSLVINEIIKATIIPTSICVGDEDLIRTSYFQLEDLTALGGVGPYTYSWSFGADSTPSATTGSGVIEVKYSTTGNKAISVTVTDAENVSKTFNYTQFVGECYRDNCGSDDFVVSSYFVGDFEGKRTTVANCNDGKQKYLYVNLSTNTDRYSLYAEFTYTISNKLTGESITTTRNGCFYENEAVPGTARTLAIDWDCGDDIVLNSIYLTFSNNIKWSCGQGPNPKCFSTNNDDTVESPLFAYAIPNELLCFDSDLGTIEVLASGGRAPYEYSIQNASNGYQDDNIFRILKAGNYDVWVRDGQGNIYQVPTVEITQPSTAVTIETTVQNIECFGGTGQATATGSGGTPYESGEPYAYLWNDPTQQTTATATGLLAGEYTVTLTDANGCQAIKTVSITQPEELTIAETGEDQVYGCGFNSTTLEANTPVTGTGEWTIVSGTGGTIAEPSNPNSEFTGTSDTYTLKWTISHPDGTCATSSDMLVTFNSNCSTLDFDGVDDHVILGDNYPLSSGSFSLEVWVKPKSVSGVRTVLSKRDYSNMSSGGFDLVINNGAPTFRWGSSSVSTSSKVTTNRWYHLAVIYNNSNVELYVDGIRVGNTAASNPANATAPFLLGGIYDSSNPEVPKNYFHGWMEELRIWNTALTVNQLRFMMNQRVVNNSGITKGEVLPMNVPNSLSWSNLQGYYRLIANEIANGETPDIATNKVNGILKNIETVQENTAPLPYISNQNGSWRDTSTWLRPTVWDVPNGIGINGDYINWNIAKIKHNIYSTTQDIYLLGLISETGELLVNGDVPNETGQGLTVTHYLKLDGTINLEGNSQLVQTEGSILDESSGGYIDIDQQGTANSFNYNYWTSPVSLTGQPNNYGYSIKEVLMDASSPADPQAISFNYQYHWADGSYSGAKRISTFWLHTFKGNADDYSEWHQFGESEILQPGIGFSMKGTMGYVPVNNRQNYTFRGKPNNGDISVSISEGQNLLTGNPYPSAIDSQKFIEENLSSFNGTLYFWDHFGAINSHILAEYVGGYAAYNLSGGIASASSIDSRINPTGERSSKTPPGRYIPVGQAFFVSSIGISSPSDLTYRNRYRAFVPESTNDSQFHLQEKTDPKKEQAKYATDSRFKIRLKFESPKGYHRQILVTADANTSAGFDLGYDAPLIENNVEDMYWMIDETEFVIQAVPDFNLDQVLPIGIKISQEGEFTIKLDELENIKTDFNIYLKDNLNNTFTNLTKEDYTTTAEELGSFNERYEIVFRKPTAEKPSEETPQELQEPILGLSYLRDTDEIAVLNPDLLYVDHVELYSISGQLIKAFNEVPTERSILLSIDQKLSSAVYIVKMYSGERVYSRKVIITK